MAKPKELYQVLHVTGYGFPMPPGTPVLEGPPAKTWSELQEDVVRVMMSDDYTPDKDLLFLVVLDGNGKLKEIDTFNHMFIREMLFRAGLEED